MALLHIPVAPAPPPDLLFPKERCYWQRLFEQAPVAIIVLRGPRFLVELANAATAAIWGRPAEPLLGQPFFQALPDAAGQGLEAIFRAVARSGEPAALTEMPVTLAQAHPGRPALGYYNFICQRLPAAAGQASVLLLVGTEVTDQVRVRQQVTDLNRELLTSNAQLTHANVDLDNFIYSASHDLKMPIDNIEGLLQGLREEIPPFVQATDHVQPMLDMMQESVNRFQLTIAQLTDLTRLQQAHEPPETLDLRATVEAVRLDLAPLLTAAAVRLTVTMDACSTGAFSGKNLRSIVYNLLSNAVKYRHPDRPPVVQLRCHNTAAATVLEVEDNGLGLDEAQQGRLFGLFERPHDHVAGSGIGLYLVKRIVENAGGRITVRSQPGLGSTFTVTFPG